MINIDKYVNDLVIKSLNPSQAPIFVTIANFLATQNPFEYTHLTPAELYTTYQDHWTTNHINQTDLYSFLVHPQVADFFNDKINELAPIIYRQLMAKLAEGNLTNPNQITKLLEYLQKLTDNNQKSFAYVFVSPTQNQATTPTLSPYKPIPTINPQPNPLTPSIKQLKSTPLPTIKSTNYTPTKHTLKATSDYDEFFD